MLLTQARLKKLFDYSPQTGIFMRLEARGPCAEGYVVGSRSVRTKRDPYVQFEVDGKSYKAHRLAWLYVYGYLPEHQIDHIDRNPSNNKIANLREVSQSCNMRNTGNRVTNVSGIKGVSWYQDREKWQACIHVDGKNRIIGYHVDFAEAVCHRLAAEQAESWEGCDSSSPAFQYVSAMLALTKQEQGGVE